MSLALNVLSPDQLLEAAPMWRDGFDTAEIAEELNVSEAAIYNDLHRIKPVYSALAPKPPNPFDNTVGGASNVFPITAPAIAARRLSDAVQVAHECSAPSVASTLRREPENCPSTRSTENLREGA